MGRTKIFYSGTENETHYNIVREYSKNALQTYFHLRSSPSFRAALKRRKEKHPEMDFIVDSGAVSLRNKFAVKNDHDFTVKQWEDYAKEYVEWVHDNRQYIYACAELDIDDIIGTHTVLRWREQLFWPLEKAGVSVIYLWHKRYGLDAWVDLCKRKRYVGLNHATFKDHTTESRMRVARKYKCKVHGFALTSYRAIRDFGLATADSVAWKSGERWMKWYIWTGKKLILILRPERLQYEKHVRDQGFNWDLLQKDDPTETSRLCMHEYARMEAAYYSDDISAEYWNVRLPYPEVLDRLTGDQQAAWLVYLGLDGIEAYRARQATRMQVLQAISCMQNMRYAEYSKNMELNNRIVSEATKTFITVNDEKTLETARDVYNGGFLTAKGAVLKRTSDDEDTLQLFGRGEEEIDEEDAEYEPLLSEGESDEEKQ